MNTRPKKLILAASLTVAAVPLLVLIALALTGHKEAQPPAEASAPPAAPAPAAAPPIVETPPPPAPVLEPFNLPPNHVIGAQIMLGEFRVIAINRYWADARSPVLTLEQALKSGDCVIRESGKRGEVTAEVKGKRPVLALTGELLLGGMQDRLVARSTLLEPGKHNLPVFTAETWQWPAGTEPFEKVMQHDPARPLVDLNVKAAIFQASSNVSVREAILQVTTALHVPDAEGRGAYVAAYKTPAASGIDELVRRGHGITCVFTVGFAVYHREKLVAAELFDSTDLFSRVSDQLLRSYAMTAVFGKVSNWDIETPAPEPEPTPPEQPDEPGYQSPNEYPPPPRPLGALTDDGTRRFECRRDVDSPPVHIGIFRK
ncbi:MAG: hypothetical protein H6839_10370 [Planctomycetes bacterium]|nr:hypothetical protein [Planctomycetota bacterium]